MGGGGTLLLLQVETIKEIFKLNCRNRPISGRSRATIAVFEVKVQIRKKTLI